jgi:hypothetical protein
VGPWEEVHWCAVLWPGRPNHGPSPSNPTIVVSGDKMLILKSISLSLLLRQQPSIFEHTRQSLLLCRWLYVCTSAVNWYKIQLLFKILQWLCLISNLSQTHFDSP